MNVLTLEEAEGALAAGRAVILPTDTVFGLGVSVRAVPGPEALYALKHRDGDKPVAWLVEGPEALDAYGSAVPPYARRLAEAFWPGALTLVVRAADTVPRAFQSAAGTIGLRMPASDAALALIRAAGCPLAVTSANISGHTAVGDATALDPSLADATAGVYLPEAAGREREAKPASPEAPPCAAHASPTDAAPLPSTVLDCTADYPRVLREGALPWNVLKGALR